MEQKLPHGAVLTDHLGGNLFLSLDDCLTHLRDEDAVPRLIIKSRIRSQGKGQNAPVDAVAAVPFGGILVADVGKPTQHLEASVSAEDEVLSRTQYDVTQVLPGENCLLALGQETFHFFSQTPEGHYQYRWSGRLPDGLLSFPVCNARAAWNGEKLALGIYDGETLTTGLSLWIYDREGTILYQGDYATSLE